MGGMEDYPIEFIKRTKEILEKNYPHFEENDREVTFLMNCLLGLIVTVSEEEKPKPKVFRGLIDNDFLKLVPQKIGFIDKSRVDDNFDLTEKDELNLPVSHWDDLKGQKKFWFLKMIRNAIAHQHIKGVNENGEWVGVQLWNEPVRKVKDFEIVFTVDELKKLAIELSNIYLTEKNPKKVGQALFSM